MPKFYSELQEASIENLASDPSATTAGRVWRNTTENRIKTDDGTNKRALLRNDQKAVIGNSGTADNNVRLHRGANGVLQTVTGSDATAEGSLSTTLNQLSTRIENYANGSLPSAANAGRVAWVTDQATVKVDDGASWRRVLTQASSGYDAATNKIINVVDPTSNQDAATKSYVDGNSSVNGAVPVRTETSGYTVLTSDQIVLSDATSAAFTVVPYTAASNTGKKIIIKKIDSSVNAITIDPASSQTIDGQTTVLLYKQYDFVEIVSDGTNWLVCSKKITPPSARYTGTTGTSLSNSAATIVFNTKDYDDYAFYNNTTGVATIPFAGKWEISATWIVTLNSTAGSGVFSHIYVGGSPVARLDGKSAWVTATNNDATMVGVTTLELAAAAQVEIKQNKDNNTTANAISTSTVFNFVTFRKID